MSQANELLDNLTDEQIANYVAEAAAKEHIVIDSNRFIAIPESLRRIGVQHDHNVTTLIFDCPRYWDDIDFSAKDIHISYEKPNDDLGAYECRSVTIDASNTNVIHFEWIIDRYATEVEGKLAFAVCVSERDSEGEEVLHWTSERNEQIYVSKGLEATPVMTEQYPDVISQLLLKMKILGGEIPYTEIENSAGGTTMTIGKEDPYANT